MLKNIINNKLFRNSPIAANEQYTLTANDVSFNESTGTVTDYTNTTEKNIIIPGDFNGVAVRSIGDWAFYNNSLTSVIIPASLTRIGVEAFYNNSLTSVTIPASLTSIGCSAFSNNRLTSVLLEADSNIRTIGAYAFAGNGLTSGITLPGHSATVFEGYFDGNGNTYNAGDNMTDFDTVYAAKVPYTLTIDDVTFDASTGTVSAYTNTTEKYIIIPGDFNGAVVTAIGREAFQNNGLSSVSIPASLTHIGDSAFAHNNLTSVSFEAGSNIRTIGEEAFKANRLSSMTIPASLTRIGRDAFAGND